MVHSGAGIGGLTFALALSRYTDIDIDIYEGAHALAEVGAGIGIFPRKEQNPHTAWHFLLQ